MSLRKNDIDNHLIARNRSLLDYLNNQGCPASSKIQLIEAIEIHRQPSDDRERSTAIGRSKSIDSHRTIERSTAIGRSNDRQPSNDRTIDSHRTIERSTAIERSNDRQPSNDRTIDSHRTIERSNSISTRHLKICPGLRVGVFSSDTSHAVRYDC